jgi:hypothetical protein
MRRADDSDVLSAVLGSLMGTLFVVAFVWLAGLGFVGGTVPVLGWTLPGGPVHGLAWLAVLSSAGVIVLWLVPLMASVAVAAAVVRLLAPVKLPSPRRPALRRSRPAKAA